MIQSIRKPRENQDAGGEDPYVHARLCHRLLSRQADHRHQRAERTAPSAQGNRQQHRIYADKNIQIRRI